MLLFVTVKGISSGIRGAGGSGVKTGSVGQNGPQIESIDTIAPIKVASSAALHCSLRRHMRYRLRAGSIIDHPTRISWALLLNPFL
jgi:hypothetical protein